jgi:exopolysaccharide production protein ExoQ
MPSLLALLLVLAFIAFLFWRDLREKPNVTGALWIPFLWLLIICSRAVSQWLALAGFQVGGGVSVEEGSPVDAVAYFILILAGTLILIRRRVGLGEIIRNNRLLTIFIIYCFFAILWSDFPFIAFKRWIKILGNPIMVLVLLTEPDPEEAFIRLMKRGAFVLFPVSILFIKYFPAWGRAYEFWTGASSNVGVTTDKNELGFDCLIFGLFFVWYLLQVRQREHGKPRRNELVFCAGFLAMIFWLLKMAHSSTSLASLLVGIAVILFLGLRFVNKSRLGLYITAGIVLILFAQFAFGIFGAGVEMLGKDPTLTGRTDLWKILLGWNINPLFGTGFESFWLGERRDKLWNIYWWHPNEAHNGYLETYLNLGLIGLALMLALFFSAFCRGRKMLLENFEFARFSLGFLAAFVLYNWTEAAFKSLHPLVLIFLITFMRYPRPQAVPVKSITGELPADENPLFENAPSIHFNSHVNEY